MFLTNTKEHFKLVCNHKKEVFKACAKAGIPWRGITHDLSKFSPTEFIESVQYYSGNRSPIDNCKDAQGYSLAWLHHRGRNRHHYEYWVDNFDTEMTPLLMPFDDALEMLCDFIGASKAYNKDKFSWDKLYEWWQNKKQRATIHLVVKRFIDYMLFKFKVDNSDETLNYRYCKIIYIQFESAYQRGELTE